MLHWKVARNPFCLSKYHFTIPHSLPPNAVKKISWRLLYKVVFNTAVVAVSTDLVHKLSSSQIFIGLTLVEECYINSCILELISCFFLARGGKRLPVKVSTPLNSPTIIDYVKLGDTVKVIIVKNKTKGNLGLGNWNEGIRTSKM